MPGSLGIFVFRLSLVWSDLGRFWGEEGQKWGSTTKVWPAGASTSALCLFTNSGRKRPFSVGLFVKKTPKTGLNGLNEKCVLRRVANSLDLAFPDTD